MFKLYRQEHEKQLINTVMKLAKKILIWVIGIMFILTGAAKLFHLDSMSEEMFHRANYPILLYYAAALAELAGGILILLPKSKRAGAALIAAVMLGAIGTHVLLGDHLGHAIVPALILLFTVSLVLKFKE